jgi:hypothetical protein
MINTCFTLFFLFALTLKLLIILGQIIIMHLIYTLFTKYLNFWARIDNSIKFQPHFGCILIGEYGVGRISHITVIDANYLANKNLSESSLVRIGFTRKNTCAQ